MMRRCKRSSLFPGALMNKKKCFTRFLPVGLSPCIQFLVRGSRPCRKVIKTFSVHNIQTREYKRGRYHCTVDLLFDWFGLVCFANKNKNYQLSYRGFQTSQTGSQWYSDTSPFSIPCTNFRNKLECLFLAGF